MPTGPGQCQQDANTKSLGIRVRVEAAASRKQGTQSAIRQAAGSMGRQVGKRQGERGCALCWMHEGTICRGEEGQ
ncbi:Hypothetical predicted protein [Podarcis lilfordi]|uniref:Uncharacterized protein n=1 Tax=Podarcis lilfordi TaxID=74358 RepID=A0AA35PIB2_9SAUR|nr:Hypothetical predicted protein [Podarcis lilfordi]